MAFLETSLFLNTPEKLKTKEARRRRRAAAYYRVFFNFGVPRIFLSFYVCFLLFPLTRVPPGRNGRGMTGGIKPPSSRRKCCARHNKTLNRATSDRTSARGMEQEAGQGGGGAGSVLRVVLLPRNGTEIICLVYRFPCLPSSGFARDSFIGVYLQKRSGGS